MRVVHLDERRVARVDGQAHADERLEPVGVGRALGAHHEPNEIKIKINNKQIINNKQQTNHEPEGAGRRVDVQRVLHGALLAAQKNHVERRVA